VETLNGNFISQTVLNSKPHPNKYTFNFNKITPFAFIGREHYNKDGNVSFTFGSMFTYKSIYQRHNTAEYLKNYQITPLVLGLAFHF
jgi:hypothetical protein